MLDLFYLIINIRCAIYTVEIVKDLLIKVTVRLNCMHYEKQIFKLINYDSMLKVLRPIFDY